MEKLQIESYKDGSKWYKRDDHYYIVERARKGTTRLRCANRRCPARWQQRERSPDLAPVRPPHNHLPQKWLQERNIMFSKLKARSLKEKTALREIYNEEADRHPNGALKLSFDSVVSSMRKWRKTRPCTVNIRCNVREDSCDSQEFQGDPLKTHPVLLNTGGDEGIDNEALYNVVIENGSLVYDDEGRICFTDPEGTLCFVDREMLPPKFFEEHSALFPSTDEAVKSITAPDDSSAPEPPSANTSSVNVSSAIASSLDAVSVKISEADRLITIEHINEDGSVVEDSERIDDIRNLVVATIDEQESQNNDDNDDYNPWTTEETIKLIDEYKKYRELFAYKSKNHVWCKIANALNKRDGLQCKCKFRNLKRAYLRGKSEGEEYKKRKCKGNAILCLFDEAVKEDIFCTPEPSNVGCTEFDYVELDDNTRIESNQKSGPRDPDSSTKKQISLNKPETSTTIKGLIRPKPRISMPKSNTIRQKRSLNKPQTLQNTTIFDDGDIFEDPLDDDQSPKKSRLEYQVEKFQRSIELREQARERRMERFIQAQEACTNRICEMLQKFIDKM